MKKRLSKQPLRMVTSPVALSSAEIYSTLTDFTDRCWRHTCSTTTHGVKTAAHNCVENNSSLFNKVNKAENIYESTHTHTKKNIVNTLLQMKKNPKTCYLIEYGRRYQNPEMFEDSLFYEPLNSILLENGFTSVLSVDQLLIAVNRHSSPGKSIYIPQLIWCCLRNNIFDITPHLFSWFKVWDWAVHAMKLILVVWNQDAVCFLVCLGSMACWNLNYKSIFGLHGARWLEFIPIWEPVCFVSPQYVALFLFRTFNPLFGKLEPINVSLFSTLGFCRDSYRQLIFKQEFSSYYRTPMTL